MCSSSSNHPFLTLKRGGKGKETTLKWKTLAELKKGDEAEFKVIEFNKEFKRVVASHTAIFREEEEKNVKAVAESVASNNNAPASTLGDNNDILAGLKAKMEKNEKKK